MPDLLLHQGARKGPLLYQQTLMHNLKKHRLNTPEANQTNEPDCRVGHLKSRLRMIEWDLVADAYASPALSGTEYQPGKRGTVHHRPENSINHHCYNTTSLAICQINILTGQGWAS